MVDGVRADRYTGRAHGLNVGQRHVALTVAIEAGQNEEDGRHAQRLEHRQRAVDLVQPAVVERHHECLIGQFGPAFDGSDQMFERDRG